MRMWSQEEKGKNRRRQVSTLTLDRLLQEEEGTEGPRVIQRMTWGIRGTHFCPARVAGWFLLGLWGLHFFSRRSPSIMAEGIKKL